MSSASIVARLNGLNQQLMTICKLRKMEDQSGEKSGPASEQIPERDVDTGGGNKQKSQKVCSCAHHETQQKPTRNTTCYCIKTCSGPQEDPSCCPRVCRPKPRPCFCKEPKTRGGTLTVGTGGNDGVDPTNERKRMLELEDPTNERKRTLKLEDPTNELKRTLKPEDPTNEQKLTFELEDPTNEQKRTLELEDPTNERKRTLELEEKLRNLTCSIKCLREDGEQQAACLRESLEKAEEQAKLAARSRNLAMDLAKQSRDQTDMLKLGRDEMMNQMSSLKTKMNKVICDNTRLVCECQDLQCKLQAVTDKEAKTCAEVADEVGRIKCSLQRKEQAMSTEKTELEEMIAELTNVVKIQKKRICELTGICNKQQETLEQKEKCLSEKNREICELQCKIKNMGCKCRELKDEIATLKCCIDEEASACNMFKRELEDSKESHCCQLRIKEKIIEDQDDTIKKLKKLVQQSEKMAKQAAREFEQLTDQLFCEKEANNSLRAAMDSVESQIGDDTAIGEDEECRNCGALENEIGCLGEQKQKALLAAKFAAQKLCEATTKFQKEQESEKRKHRFLMLMLRKKEEEIGCLKREVLHVRDSKSLSRNSCCN